MNLVAQLTHACVKQFPVNTPNLGQSKINDHLLNYHYGVLVQYMQKLVCIVQ